jgi:hypothetical protein
MRLKLREDPREWQKFVLGAVVGLAAVGGVLRWRAIVPGRWLVLWLAALGVALLAVLLRPARFRGFYRAGATAGYHVGQFMGQILLVLFFFLVLTPLGLALRLAGKDLLRLKRDRSASSYWQPAPRESQLDKMF